MSWAEICRFVGVSLGGICWHVEWVEGVKGNCLWLGHGEGRCGLHVHLGRGYLGGDSGSMGVL